MKNSRLIADLDANRGYSGIPTFLRSNICKNLDNIDATYAVLGVPYDEGSPYWGIKVLVQDLSGNILFDLVVVRFMILKTTKNIFGMQYLTI